MIDLVLDTKAGPYNVEGTGPQTGRRILEDGTTVNIGNIQNQVAINTGYQDYFEAISQGIITDKTFIYKFGRTETLIGKRVPFWDLGGYYTFPDTAAIVSISSDSIDDNPAGIGARKVKIYGLDTNFEEINESVLVGEDSINSYKRLHRMYVEESGLNEFPYDDTYVGNNIGTILATHNGTALPICAIQPRNGQTLMAIFTIPLGYTGYMWSASTGIGKGQDAIGFLYTREFNIGTEPWLTKGIRDMYQNQVGNIFKIPIKYKEKTDIVFAVEGSQSGNTISGSFLLELIKNEVI